MTSDEFYDIIYIYNLYDERRPTSMTKCYVSEEQLREIFVRQFVDEDILTTSDLKFLAFREWLEVKKERGEIELVEFNHYEVSKLGYKPVAKLVGTNGNIFNLMDIASKVLDEAGKEEKSKELRDRITSQAKSYNEALLIIMEYVEVE